MLDEKEIEKLEKTKNDLLRICDKNCSECPLEYEGLCLVETLINNVIYEAQKE